MEKTCYHLFSGYKNSKENKLNVVIYFRKITGCLFECEKIVFEK